MKARSAKSAPHEGSVHRATSELTIMGLLYLDVTRHGIIMGADSKPIIIREGQIENVPDERDRPHVLPHFRLHGFVGFLGYIGTEVIDGKNAFDWFSNFAADHVTDNLSGFSSRLAQHLDEVWQRNELETGLWVFLSGYATGGDAKFWWLNNIGGINNSGQLVGTYRGVGRQFQIVDDLDSMLARQGITPGAKSAIFSAAPLVARYWNGYLLPPALGIFEQFRALVQALDQGQFEGFQLTNLRQYAYVAHMQMEFLKRLYKPQKAIYSGKNPPFGGKVYTYAITPEGQRHLVDHNGTFKAFR